MSVKSVKSGARSVSLLAGNTPEHHVLLAETTVGAGGTASVTFSNIDQSYQHLQIRMLTGCASPTNGGLLQFNGDTGANYAVHYLYGTGSAAGSAAASSTTYGYAQAYIGAAMTTGPAASVMDILDYSNTSKYKTVRSLNGYDANGSGIISFYSSLWRSTSAVTTILMTANGTTYAQYSTFQLYGVK